MVVDFGHLAYSEISPTGAMKSTGRRVAVVGIVVNWPSTQATLGLSSIPRKNCSKLPNVAE